MIQKYIVM